MALVSGKDIKTGAGLAIGFTIVAIVVHMLSRKG